MDIKKFVAGYVNQINDLQAVYDEQTEIIKKAEEARSAAFDKFVEDIKSSVSEWTKDEMQEFFTEAFANNLSDHYQAIVLAEFAETHEGQDRRVAENTLRMMMIKMNLDEFSGIIAEMLSK